MNKKAFTLVELLGVIVILALLALITIPIISNVVINARINSLRDSAYGLIEASNLYYVQKGVNENIRFDKNDNTDTLKELSYKGVVKQGTVIIDKKGNVTVCITDGKNSAYKNYNESKVTTSKGKICNIKDNSSIVYLDDEATITQYDNAKLTELVNSLQEQINEKPTKEEMLNEIYPVGSIYISTTDSTVDKVETRFGGTWVVYAEGETLVGYKSGDNDYSINKEGGNKDITLIANQIPTLSISGSTVATTASNAALEAGNHRHRNIFPYKWSSGNSDAILKDITYQTIGEVTGKLNAPFTENAGNHTHNVSIPALTVEASYRNDTQTSVDIRNPYITVYMYKRTA